MGEVLSRAINGMGSNGFPGGIIINGGGRSLFGDVYFSQVKVLDGDVQVELFDGDVFSSPFFRAIFELAHGSRRIDVEEVICKYFDNSIAKNVGFIETELDIDGYV